MHPFFNPHKRKQAPFRTPELVAKTRLGQSDDDDDNGNDNDNDNEDDDTTEMKLALLASLHPDRDHETLLDALLTHGGSVSRAATALESWNHKPASSGKKDMVASAASAARLGYQPSLKSFAVVAHTAGAYDSSSAESPALPRKKSKSRARMGSTLHLYDPQDVAEHTPCTIIHNFLPAQVANDLLEELLNESDTFEQNTFQLFNRVVSSPHTASFYVDSDADVHRQKTEYYYNGARLTDVRHITPQLLKVKTRVQEAVNDEIQHRIQTRYPGSRKLRYQSPKPWVPNSAFVNCYNGPQESVGWHSDQLTYLGPRAVIGSISLGVAREFRVRRVLPRDDNHNANDGINATADDDAANEGQISIHLPHNSLLVMHAEMQEEWKHCIAPAASVDPHPVAGKRRINVTYRDYRAAMHPRNTPRCTCDLPCVLRVVQRKRENYGRYFWMCHGGNIAGRENCPFFQWADFDHDGNPLWAGNRDK